MKEMIAALTAIMLLVLMTTPTPTGHAVSHKVYTLKNGATVGTINPHTLRYLRNFGITTHESRLIVPGRGLIRVPYPRIGPADTIAHDLAILEESYNTVKFQLQSERWQQMHRTGRHPSALRSSGQTYNVSEERITQTGLNITGNTSTSTQSMGEDDTGQEISDEDLQASNESSTNNVTTLDSSDLEDPGFNPSVGFTTQ